jgi:hypothetical protein
VQEGLHLLDQMLYLPMMLQLHTLSIDHISVCSKARYLLNIDKIKIMKKTIISASMLNLIDVTCNDEKSEADSDKVFNLQCEHR